MERKISKYNCAFCNVKGCYYNKMEDVKMPTCPTKHEKDNLKDIEKEYKDPETNMIAKKSAEVVMDNYGKKTRLEETIDFCNAMGYKKIGLAFCFALREEALEFAKIMIKEGFQIESLMCKMGRIDRDVIGIKDFPIPLCNPIAQAEFLNKEKTDFNIILGLCVGHDTLFIKHSKAPVSIFAVKDRALKHNPILGIEAYKEKNKTSK